MFKLATLLALGTAYLLMFAWIEEVSAVDATVSLSYIERQHLAACIVMLNEITNHYLAKSISTFSSQSL